MANEKRLRALALGGLVEDNPLTAAAVALTSAALAAVPAVTATDHLAVILDPDGSFGAPEVAYVTLHTAGANTATIARGQEGTTARQHDRDVPWVHAPTLKDFDAPNGGVGIIGYNSYNPASIGSTSSSSATFADVDATNMKVTFTAPPSGRVMVVLSALTLVQTSTEYMDWNLRDAGGDVAGTTKRALGGLGGAQLAVAACIDKSGLTPGTSYTWKWGLARSAGTGANVVTTYYGGVAGSAVMTVYAINA